MDKTTEAEVVEVVESPAEAGAPTPETDDSVTDEFKGRSKVTAIEGDKPVGDSTTRIRPASADGDKPVGDSTVRIRPAAPTADKPWAPGNVSSPPPPPPPTPSMAAPPRETADRRPPAGMPSPSLEMTGKKQADTAGRAPRKAHLVLRRVEPWSAMKFSFVVSLVCFVVLFVAVAVLYMVLNGLGVFDSIVQTVNQFTQGEGNSSANSFDIAAWFEPVRILGYTALIGAVNVVLITALSTLGAVIYNVASDLVGGIEVTFSEAE
ncbi:DUF3566 domain-containing protein [Planomonospora venezuelensis]|uniref:DUF3566 domain-containing protein n=1 Tax=Planomonospora venezuelensis TaxID=1999 RepID=A0A841DIG0_PLAVE|nr:DUF3566 domain-containing protein [Planomonospora venezuelensis]MBB5968088.1 hypothetical protein [Planomonospora venezuelensis]GIN05791.1 hypothetical protein Pve01_74490 [Planomonospora venezuelensis]